jgi:hypothetical protein
MNTEGKDLSVVVLSISLVMTARLVSCVVAPGFETPGAMSIREPSAVCFAAGLYLAFGQSWVAPWSSRSVFLNG